MTQTWALRWRASRLDGTARHGSLEVECVNLEGFKLERIASV